MNLLIRLKRQYTKLALFKMLVILVFVYPILPLSLLATFFTFGSLFESIIKGDFEVSWQRDLMMYLFYSGGFSGLIGGIMVLRNRVNFSSLLLFLHGAVSYSFVIVNFIFYSDPPWYGAVVLLQSNHDFTLPFVFWVLHKFYLASTLVVLTYLLYLMVKKVIADYQADKKVNVTVFKGS